MPGKESVTPRWHEVVRANHHKTLGLVVAERGTCLRIQRDEEHLVPGRTFRPVRPRDLAGIDLDGSWFLGVLLCPGDDTEDLARWASGIPKTDLWRVRFYHVDGTDVADALRGWMGANLPEPARFLVNDFRSFHSLYGRHHADVVYRDAMEPEA